MVRDKLIVLRVESETKERIEQVAQQRGESVTTFVLEAVDNAVCKAERQPISPTNFFRGVPRFFQALCEEAKRGGTSGYKDAGWHLGLHVSGLVEAEDDDEREKKLTQLRDLLDDEDWDGLEAWFVREFPKCMALVPKRRRQQFLQGVDAVDQERDPIY
ncbi:DUF1778 domain-containing protein [Candidatus Acetothermia bacterium]|nr:DUF1778 domain-containing protein [Candidatus Acetothermia bacterium]